MSDEGNHNPYWYRIQAMEASGRVGFLDPQEFDFDGEFFAKIAELGGDKFRIEAHDCINCNVRLLINGRTYSFDVDDGEAWYDVTVSCEMLNAILKRHELEERFFVFSEPYGNSYMLFAMFAKPSVAKELADKYGNPFVKGCEAYWK